MSTGLYSDFPDSLLPSAAGAAPQSYLLYRNLLATDALEMFRYWCSPCDEAPGVGKAVWAGNCERNCCNEVVPVLWLVPAEVAAQMAASPVSSQHPVCGFGGMYHPVAECNGYTRFHLPPSICRPPALRNAEAAPANLAACIARSSFCTRCPLKKGVRACRRAF